MTRFSATRGNFFTICRTALSCRHRPSSPAGFPHVSSPSSSTCPDGGVAGKWPELPQFRKDAASRTCKVVADFPAGGTGKAELRRHVGTGFAPPTFLLWEGEAPAEPRPKAARQGPRP